MHPVNYDLKIAALREQQEELEWALIRVKGEIFSLERARYEASPEARRIVYLEARTTEELQALCLPGDAWDFYAAITLIRRAYRESNNADLREWIEKTFNEPPYCKQIGIRRALRDMEILRDDGWKS